MAALHRHPSCSSADTLLRHPFTAVVAGSTGAGKTVFLSKLVSRRNTMITPPVSRVLYSYKRYQTIFDSMDGVEFVKGSDYTLDPAVPTLLIIDDQASDSDSIDVERLFTVDSHHSNTSVVLVTQNLFQQSKSFRTAALNAQYLFLFKSPRGMMQVSTLARQLYPPSSSRRMIEAYADATTEPFTYLLVDLKSDTPPQLRLRAHILPGEGMEFMGATLTRCYRI